MRRRKCLPKWRQKMVETRICETQICVKTVIFCEQTQQGDILSRGPDKTLTPQNLYVF